MNWNYLELALWITGFIALAGILIWIEHLGYRKGYQCGQLKARQELAQQHALQIAVLKRDHEDELDRLRPPQRPRPRGVPSKE